MDSSGLSVRDQNMSRKKKGALAAEGAFADQIDFSVLPPEHGGEHTRLTAPGAL